jgi:hypothetical protein
MDEWLDTMAQPGTLSGDAAQQLEERGFTVLDGLLSPTEAMRLADAYDAAAAVAAASDVRAGSTTTRIADFVNRGAAFDPLYVLPPVLSACCAVIGGPFKLSSFHARTLRPCSPAQDLHVDVRPGSRDWPLVGFIVMIDPFRPDNGATRFVPGSHRNSQEDMAPLDHAVGREAALACGPAGSLVIFNGSTWHGHSANMGGEPRRSLQGAFIPRTGNAATDFAVRMHADTRARLGRIAQYVLAL